MGENGHNSPEEGPIGLRSGLSILISSPGSIGDDEGVGFVARFRITQIGKCVDGWVGPRKENGAKIARSPIVKSVKHSSNVGEIDVLVAYFFAPFGARFGPKV